MSEYVVYGYSMLDGLETLGLVAYLEGYNQACRLVRYVLRLGMHRSEFYRICDDNTQELQYTLYASEYCTDDTLESLRQLREAGAFDPCELMPDPEDSPFFATPCAPMAAV